MTNYNIPAAVEEAVVTRIYAEAHEAGWPHLQDADRTSMYQKWTDDPEIGLRLLDFVGQAANIRPWLKDCPMKEYERARRGKSKYARYVAQPAATLEQIVEGILGREWEVIPGSMQDKPWRARIRRIETEEERHFVAGSVASLKHMMWPAIIDRSNGETWPWTICVFDPFQSPVTVEKRADNERLAKFLGVDIVYFKEV
ncbi:hypothetical protein MXD61_04330 [Frankia sp. AgPm24]|uniref:hypothetical protein n=1 Tax=Frankia sp. AgPm24 TaxID=631128 RepID=UPI0020109C72|nr:hypothetical protein [Frankia sp. AgPm24]MCK9921141.1 hypothetical protein [Frankia sp. AgPm24]